MPTFKSQAMGPLLRCGNLCRSQERFNRGEQVLSSRIASETCSRDPHVRCHWILWRTQTLGIHISELDSRPRGSPSCCFLEQAERLRAVLSNAYTTQVQVSQIVLPERIPGLGGFAVPGRRRLRASGDAQAVVVPSSRVKLGCNVIT